MPRAKTVPAVPANVSQTGVWVSAYVLRDVFGIHQSVLTGRNVPMRVAAAGKQYRLDAAVRLAPDVIRDRMIVLLGGVADDSEFAPMNIKELKTLEEIKKLQLENRERSKELIDANEVEQTYTRGIKRICDGLDGLPLACKMARPDISSDLLDVINRAVITARNNAAALDFTQT